MSDNFEAALTVRELIERLQELPEEVQDWPVSTEGCCCYGDAGSVVVDRDTETVDIRRASEKAAEAQRLYEESRTYQPSPEEIAMREKGLLPE